MLADGFSDFSLFSSFSLFGSKFFPFSDFSLLDRNFSLFISKKGKIEEIRGNKGKKGKIKEKRKRVTPNHCRRRVGDLERQSPEPSEASRRAALDLAATSRRASQTPTPVGRRAPQGVEKSVNYKFLSSLAKYCRFKRPSRGYIRGENRVFLFSRNSFFPFPEIS